MDIVLLKTFLEVNRTRHFGRAAERLFLTQSAISARIKLLEQTLGVALFIRKRNDIQLTPAGSRLLRHAETIVDAWERARQQSGLEGERNSVLAIGGLVDIWDIFLQQWLHALHGQLTDTALFAEALPAESLVRRVLDGVLDVGFLFEPPHIPELAVRQVATVPLALISTRQGLSAEQALGSGYVMVDWGASFAVAHARYFPDMPPPAIRMGLGVLARAFLLGCGGSAYLAKRSVAGLVEQGRLYDVDEAPEIERFAYAVYMEGSGRAAEIRRALDFLNKE